MPWYSQYKYLYLSLAIYHIMTDGRVADGAEYDWGSLARYAVMGTAVFPPLMFNWYKWLDTRYILIKVI